MTSSLDIIYGYADNMDGTYTIRLRPGSPQFSFGPAYSQTQLITLGSLDLVNHVYPSLAVAYSHLNPVLAAAMIVAINGDYGAGTVSLGQIVPYDAAIHADIKAINTLLGSGVTRQSGVITRAAATASGTQDIPTSFQPSLVIFSAIDDADASVTSDGWDDCSGISVCTFTSSQNVLTNLLGGVLAAAITNKDHSNSIKVSNGTNGHSAKVSAVASNKFTLTWTKLGSGKAATVKYVAIK